jgi:hypothetical protein
LFAFVFFASLPMSGSVFEKDMERVVCLLWGVTLLPESPSREARPEREKATSTVSDNPGLLQVS